MDWSKESEGRDHRSYMGMMKRRSDEALSKPWCLRHSLYDGEASKIYYPEKTIPSGKGKVEGFLFQIMPFTEANTMLHKCHE